MSQKYNVFKITVFLVIGMIVADKLRHSYSAEFWGVATVAALLSLVFVWKKPLLASLTLFTALITLGGFIMSVDWRGRRVDIPPFAVKYKAFVSSTPVFTNNHWTCDLTTYSLKKEYKLKAHIYMDTLGVRLGDCVDCVSKWKKPRDFPHKGHFSYSTYLERHGYAGITSFWKDVSLRKNGDEAQGVAIKAKLLRERLVEALRGAERNAAVSDTAAESQDFAIITAMLLGEKAFLSRETKEDYSNAGISHVLALSGLHLSIIQGMLAMLLFAFGRKKRAALQLLFIWPYTFLVGMPVSLVRVAVMFTVFVLAEAMKRQSDGYNNLSIAAFVIIICSPQSLYDIGFQLSFAAVLAIIVMHEFFHPSWWSGILLVSLAAQLGTLPLLLYHFGQFPTYFLLTNIFVAILAPVILGGSIAALCLVFAPSVQWYVLEGLSYAAKCLNGIAHFVATLPYSTIQNLYINIPQTVILYVLIAALVAPLGWWKIKRRKLKRRLKRNK